MFFLKINKNPFSDIKRLIYLDVVIQNSRLICLDSRGKHSGSSEPRISRL